VDFKKFQRNYQINSLELLCSYSNYFAKKI
jgi:hypothetical protein